MSKPIQICCQTPVQSPDFSLGLGVDFVLPLSQEEQQQEQQEQQEPHQNIYKRINLAKAWPNQTKLMP